MQLQEVFKNTFFVEPLGATASEPSNQPLCSDIIKKYRNEINNGNIFDYSANFRNAFCLLRSQNLGFFQGK